MSRHGSTKEQILDMVSNGDETLTSISKKLKLAPSTVSKHLDELKASGAIIQKENDHIKKWKYYTIASKWNNGEVEGSRPRINKNVAIVISAMAFAAIVAFLLVAYTNNGIGNLGTINIPISITDPPSVPSGTSALYINYSSVTVLTNKDGSVQNLQFNVSGRVDLMSLVNESQVIGTIVAQTNTKMYGVIFNIDSASITIGNVTYPVQLQNNRISADMVNSGTFNSTSGILLDFFPVVVPMYNQGKTSFEMLATMRAAVISNPTQKQAGMGSSMYARRHVPANVLDLFPTQNPNLYISNVSVVEEGNSLALSINMDNNASENITVYGAAIMDSVPGAYHQSQQWAANGTITVQGGGTAGPIGPGMMMRQHIIIYNESKTARSAVGSAFFNQTNSTLSINSSRLFSIGQYIGNSSVVIKLPTPVSNITISSMGMQNPNVPFYAMAAPASIVFVADAKGTLSLLNQTHGAMAMHVNGGAGGESVVSGSIVAPNDTPLIGYVVGEKAAGLLTYNGPVPIYAFGSPVNLTGENYTVMLMTSGGIVQKTVYG